MLGRNDSLKLNNDYWVGSSESSQLHISHGLLYTRERKLY
jgi:hypothetical protein